MAENNNRAASNRTDRYAIEKCIDWLQEQNFTEVTVTNHPTDIHAKKDGISYNIELKMTTKNDVYFGAASITEWNAMNNGNEDLLFVIARSKDGSNDGNTTFDFSIYNKDDMKVFSSIPPFKVNINMPLDAQKAQEKIKKSKDGSRKSRALRLDFELVRYLNKLHEILKNPKKKAEFIQFMMKM